MWFGAKIFFKNSFLSNFSKTNSSEGGVIICLFAPVAKGTYRLFHILYTAGTCLSFMTFSRHLAVACNFSLTVCGSRSTKVDAFNGFMAIAFYPFISIAHYCDWSTPCMWSFALTKAQNCSFDRVFSFYNFALLSSHLCTTDTCSEMSLLIFFIVVQDTWVKKCEAAQARQLTMTSWPGCRFTLLTSLFFL